MSNNRQLSLREKTKSALERLSAIEEDYTRLTQGVNSMFSQNNNRLGTLEEQVLAIIENIGEDAIQATITETRKRKQQEQADAAKTEIEQLVKDGTLVPAFEVGEDSFIIGHDVDDAGETIHPGFGHVHFKQVKPELQEKVKGAAAGITIPVGEQKEGSKRGFVIDQIYTFVPPKPKEETPAAATAETPDKSGIHSAELGDATDKPVEAK